MTGKLLLRGMLAGLIAGFLAFGLLKVAGEPQVDRAIAFETSMDEAKAKAEAEAAAAKGQAAPAAEAEPELVSRATQGGIGLLTGVLVFGTAFGGLFALAFALTYGRIGDLSPRATAAVLALLGFVAVYLVPLLKYPANPPAVGLPDTIGMRTNLYFSMVFISLAVMIAAALVRGALASSLGAWNSTVVAAVAYIVVMAATIWALPGVNEVPENFPADLLWNFRVVSLGGQALLWTATGLIFGALAQQALRQTRPALREVPAV